MSQPAPPPDALLAWYDRAKRDLPWRGTRDPYAIWLSEIMAQQTRVETVIPYWSRFLAAYPSVVSLAEAPLDDVLALWSGLGYYRRARLLHEAAREIAARGAFPDTVDELREVRGIGAYTAGAVASMAFGRRAAVVDGNVARVLSRWFALEEDARSSRGVAALWRLAERLVPPLRPGDWNQALMELGATVCTPRAPRCDACPIAEGCGARATGRAAELPRLRAKTPPREARLVALVASRGARVLLARRRAEGLFGGLWEPPVADHGGDARASARALAARVLGAPVASALALRSRGTVEHVLSHRRLAIEVVCAAVPAGARARALDDANYDARVWVAVGDFGGAEVAAGRRGDLAQLGISALAKKVLARARGGR